VLFFLITNFSRFSNPKKEWLMSRCAKSFGTLLFKCFCISSKITRVSAS
jgi:hypothetical protein